MLLSEHAYCVAVSFKMTEWIEQPICIKFSFKLEHSSMETIRMIQKSSAMGNWWLVASSHLLMQRFLAKHQILQVAQHPLRPRFSTLWFLAFPKTKITFEREEISDNQWDSGKYNYNWENCVKSQGTYFEYLTLWRGRRYNCPMYNFFVYLLSSSVNVSIFHITWLDTFWKD